MTLSEILEKLLTLSAKDSSLEFYIETEKSFSLEFKDEIPFLEEEAEETYLAVRYLNEKGLCGITYTLSLTEDGINSAITLAKDLSTYGKASLYPPLPETYIEISTPSFPPPKKEDFLELHEIALSEAKAHRGIKRVERETYNFSSTKLYLIREGKKFEATLSEVSFYVSLVAKGKRKEASSYAYSSAISLERLKVRELVSRAAFKAYALSHSEKGSSQRVAILFPPECAIELLSLLSFSFLGDEVVKGRSYLKDKLGKKVFSPRLTLIDDGINPELPESRAFDDEGMPQEKTVLISAGEIKSFLWNYYYGRQAGFSSTGNARKKAPSSPPEVDHTNLYFLPSHLSKEDFLQREKRVFEVLEILGGHTANPISGDFSFGVSGILYEEGEAISYLSEMALSGNIFEIFKDVEVGGDLTFFGSLGSPSLLFQPMDLG